MSAMMLPRLHIHCLVAAGFIPLPEMDPGYRFAKFEPMQFALNEHGGHVKLGPETAEVIGQALVDANLSSIIACYDDRAPGIIHENDIKRYQWPNLEEALTTPAETLNAISCYEYQSNEHKEWTDSMARRYCEKLRRHVCSLVPGFTETGWCMLAQKVEERRALHLL